MKNIFINISWWLLFLILATIFLVWYNQTFIVTDSLYYNTYGEKLSLETIEVFIENAHRYWWISYLAVPFVILFRILFTSTCLYLGFFFKNQQNGFNSCWKVAVFADTVYLFAGLVSALYLMVVPPDTITQASLTPFTFMYYLDVESIPKYLLYPIGLINLFEFAYWITLAVLMKQEAKMPFEDSISFILSTYGVGLLLVAMIFTLIFM